MQMYFHGGYNEVILFSGWHPETVGSFVGSVVALFFIAMAYEALKYYR